MAVVNVTFDQAHSTGPDLTVDGQEATRVYNVLMDGADDPTMEGQYARMAADVPRVYAIYDTLMPWLRCVRVGAPEAVGLHYYKVTCTYACGGRAPEPVSARHTPKADSPLNEPVRYEGGVYEETVPMEYDQRGNWIRTSAGQRIEGLTMSLRYPVLFLTRNVATYDELSISQLIDTVNAHPFRDRPVWSCWMRDIVPKALTSGQVSYWELRYEIVWNWRLRPSDEEILSWPDPGAPLPTAYSCWQTRVPNAGSAYFWLSGGKHVLREFVAAPNRPFAEKVPLDAYGGPLAGWYLEPDSGTGQNGQPADVNVEPMWLYWQRFPAVDWSWLRLE